MANNAQYDERYLSLISKEIKRLRIAKGFSSYETFAIEKNLDRKQYWRVENGQNITVKTLTKVLDGLEISFADFFKDLD